MTTLFNPATGSSKLFKKSLHPSLFERNSKQIKLLRSLKKIVKVKDTTENTKPSVLRCLPVVLKPENKPQLYISERGQAIEAKAHSTELEAKPQNNFTSDTPTKKAVQQINEPVKPIDFADNLLNGEYINRIRPDHIDAKHWEELVIGSGIDPELASLNVVSLSGNSVSEYICYGLDDSHRTNTGKLRGGYQKRYSHLYSGGWYVPTLDIETGENRLWGCFKPNDPAVDADGKIIKYEHPAKVATECFFLRVSPKIWEKIANKHGLDLPENYQDVIDHPELFWQWVINSDIRIILTEGAKKALAGLSAGYVFIAFPGINSVIKTKDELKNKCKPFIDSQFEKFLGNKRQIHLCFDKDAKYKSITNVNKALKFIGGVLVRKSCIVKVWDWDRNDGKGLDDVFVQCGEERIDNLAKDAINFFEWKVKTLKELSYIPDLPLNQRYLTRYNQEGKLELDFKINKPWNVLYFKSPKNSSKSRAIELILNPIIRSGSRKVLLLTHRIQLGRILCDLFGIRYIDEKTDNENIERCLGLCIDSIGKVNLDEWKGAYLVIDEIQQFKWHLLNSATCKENRAKLMKLFKQLIDMVIRTEGKIIIADADLRDDGINFISDMTDADIKLFGIVNTFKREENDCWTIHNYVDKKPDRLISDMLIMLNAGKRIFYCTGGQSEQSKAGTTNIEDYIKNQLPENKVLRVDRLTVGDTTHESFGILSIVNGENIFEKEAASRQITVASPTVETGISVEKVGLFDAVFGVFSGLQSCDSVRQFLSRYRPNVPRYIWLAPKGMNSAFIGNGSDDPGYLISGENNKLKSHLAILNSVGCTEQPDGEILNPFLTSWGIDAAIVNNGFKNYRKTILHDLANEGHKIVNNLPAEDEVFDSKALKENQVELEDKFNQSVVDAVDVSDDDFKKLADKINKTHQERLQHHKGRLARTYQVPITKELVDKDNDDFYSVVKRHYYLLNPDSMVRLESRKMTNINKAGEGAAFTPDINKAFKLSTESKLLKDIGLLEILETSGLHESHELAVRVGEQIRKNIWIYEQYICKFRTDKTDIPSNLSIIRTLLDRIGYKLPQTKQKREGDKTIWLHDKPAIDWEKIVTVSKNGKQRTKPVLDANGDILPIIDERFDIFTAWQAKEALEIAKEQEKLAQFNFPAELAQVMGNAVKSQDYSGSRKWFESALSSAINSSDYWEVVQVVEKLESSIVTPDKFGHLTLDQSSHNDQLRNILSDVIGDNAQAIHTLQIHQSKWESGDRQLITPQKAVAVTPTEQVLISSPVQKVEVIPTTKQPQPEFITMAESDIDSIHNYVVEKLELDDTASLESLFNSMTLGKKGIFKNAFALTYKKISETIEV
ncbi:DUF3854 domain-containing protein [Anabaena sp. UHCC 0253]|uniref:plasmid replication protein, CyRepA1 family n=1 Tax=Anabaena sp. UHCC 0253 TaxID=2590019 RepID=UPI001446C7EB|nr:plasmid replication protein, CyRepA1 family [Anabaena sp. UHCC 0253]MTJ56059.1 DUF3854 domain-containing protein [Anabaena sp. UHCC 0253]